MLARGSAGALVIERAGAGGVFADGWLKERYLTEAFGYFHNGKNSDVVYCVERERVEARS